MINRYRHRLSSRLILLGVVAVFAGCYYDIESELYPDQQPCDPSAFTYSGRVLPIIQQNCISCHGQANGSGGIILEGYVNLRNSAVAGTLLCAVRHGNGCSPMPQNGSRLTDCDINAIQAWVDAGAPEN